MATITELRQQLADASLSIQYDNVTNWVSAVILAGSKQWFVTVTDTVSGQTISRILSAGTIAVPANAVSWAAKNGVIGPDGNAPLGSRISLTTRYPA